MALAAACSSGQGGPYSLAGTATVNGTVGGQALGASDAISGLESPGNPSDVTAGWILITTVADECSVVTAHQKLKNGTQLLIALGISSGNGKVSPPTVGVYTVYASNISSQQGGIAGAQFTVADASCVPATFASATTGTVRLTRAEETGYGGTFDLVFATPADHLTGSFNTGACTAFGRTPISSCPP